MPENWSVPDVAALRSDPAQFADASTSLTTKLGECEAAADALHSIGVSGWSGLDGEAAAAMGVLVQAVGISMQALPNTARSMVAALADAAAALDALQARSDQLLLDAEAQWLTFTAAREARADAEQDWRQASGNLERFAGADPKPLEDEVIRTRGERTATRRGYTDARDALDALQLEHGTLRDDEDAIHFDVAVAQFAMDFVDPMAAPGVAAVTGSDGSILPLLDDLLEDPTLHDGLRQEIRDARSTIDDFDGDDALPLGGSDDELLAAALAGLGIAKADADNGDIPGQEPTIITLTGRADGVVVIQLPDGRLQVFVNGVATTYNAEESRNLVIDTGGGNDQVIIGPNVSIPIVVRTGDGSDVVDGGGAGDLIDTGAGNDRINSGGGGDRISAGGGNDTVNGGDDGDLIVAGGGEDNVQGGGGADTIHGGNDADTIHGGDGNDAIHGDDGGDKIEGEAGDDDIDAGRGIDYVEGNDGADTVVGGADDDTVYGGLGNDTIDGGDGNDNLHGGGGNDDLRGGDGNDIVSGSSGDDVLRGGEGDDIISTGSGDDHVVADGFGDADVLYAETGDTVQAGAGDDVITSDIDFDIFADTNGDGSPQIVIDPTADADFRDRVQADLELLAQTPDGRILLANIIASGNTVTITESIDGGSAASAAGGYRNPDGTAGAGTSSTIRYSPTGRLGDERAPKLDDTPPVVILAHELIHSDDHLNGTRENGSTATHDVNANPTDSGTPTNPEHDAVGTPYDPFVDVVDSADPGSGSGDGVDDVAGLEAHPGTPSENSIRIQLGLEVRDAY